MNVPTYAIPVDRFARSGRNAEAEPFTHLVSRHKDRLFAYLSRLSCDRSQAEDLLQETLLRAWRAFPRYDHRDKFSSWIFSIAHNTALDARRSAGVREAMVSVADPLERPAVDDPESLALAQELTVRVNELLNALPPKQLRVFLLRQHSDMSFKEIARLTQQPLSTVLGHMHYAVKKLRKLLRDYHYGSN